MPVTTSTSLDDAGGAGHSAGSGGPAGDGPPRPSTTPPRPVSQLADRIADAVAGPRPALLCEHAEGAATMISGATLRAQEVRPGDLFAALPGARAHGADHAATALARGAAALLTDPAGAERPEVRDAGVPVLVHESPRAALGPAAALVYDDPSTRLGVLGVTGTSGKTTTVYLLEAALAAAGARTGLVGTVETRIAGERTPSAFTTPEAPDLQALLAVMAERGVTHTAMEVSSHALALDRVAGTRFAVGAFTNLSPEHLDFHADMEGYFAAKARLFDGRAATEVVCADPEWGARLVTDATVTVAPTADPPSPDQAGTDSTGTDWTGTDWRAADVVAHPDGTQTFRALGPGVDMPVRLHLPGRFNVVNAMLALACGAAAGFDPELLATGLAAVRVPGRMQRVASGRDVLAVVDYAHKPAAVSALLTALRAQAPGRVLVVLGCGGDRDRAKRPVMGRLAAELADAVWVTDDNPRSEDPAAIRASILEGARGVADAAEVHEQGDRRAAIREAVAAARPGDAVVVAGKGHETGQKVGETTLPFSDVEELAAALAGAGSGTGAAS